MDLSNQNQTFPTPTQRPEVENLNAIAQDIKSSYIWVVFCVGFPGNLFSIVTVLTMRSLTPATWYVVILALCDALTLVTKLVGHQMLAHNAYIGTVGCKAFFVTNFLSTLGNWILVLICAERCVSVCFPLKRHLIFTKRRAYISTLVLSLTLFAMFSVMSCVMRDATKDGLRCGTVDEYLTFWTTGWYWINTCIHFFLPLFIIVVLTTLIVRGLRKSRRDRRHIIYTGNNGSDSNTHLLREAERLERNISIMVILVVVLFLVLTFPACIYILAYKKSSDETIEARWKLFDEIQYLCIDSSHAINFFLYFLSVKKFREQFIFLITCHKWPKDFRKKKCNNKVNHSTTGTTKYSLARSMEELSKFKASNVDLRHDH